jgi:hypothetical protein
MRRVEHVAHMGKEINDYKMLVRNLEEKKRRRHSEWFMRGKWEMDGRYCPGLLGSGQGPVMSYAGTITRYSGFWFL